MGAAGAFGSIAQLSLACVLTFSGLSKAGRPRALSRVIAELESVESVPLATAWVVIAAELATGSMLVLAPVSVWPRAGAAVLACLFAIAGLRAVTSGLRLRCECFGSGGGALGWHQVLALPAWLGLLAVAQMAGLSWERDTGLAVLASMLYAGFIFRFVRGLPRLRDVHADRVALS